MPRPHISRPSESAGYLVSFHSAALATDNIYIYIYIEREREGDIDIYIYIYIYIYTERDIERYIVGTPAGPDQGQQSSIIIA